MKDHSDLNDFKWFEWILIYIVIFFVIIYRGVKEILRRLYAKR